METKEFGSIDTIVTTDFEAMYTHTNVATISSVCSCQHRMFTRCCTLIQLSQVFRLFPSLSKCTLERLILKMIAHKAVTYIRTIIEQSH